MLEGDLCDGTGLKSVGNKFEELIDGTLPAELKEKAPKGAVEILGRSVVLTGTLTAHCVSSQVAALLRALAEV
jgi:hypothetical protein